MSNKIRTVDSVEPVSLPAKSQRLEMSIKDLVSRKKLITKAYKEVMKRDVHYGKLFDGKNSKDILYKAGAEVILNLCMIAIKVTKIEDLSLSDCVKYRITVSGYHQLTGAYIGDGIGECSSDEEKYRWRDSVCEPEFNDTPENRKRKKYSKGRQGSFYIRNQVRTEPADVSNTILKMAKKRAMVDFTLTAMGASDIFEQDLEDLPDEIANSLRGEPGEIYGEEASKIASAKTTQDIFRIMGEFSVEQKQKYGELAQRRLTELKNAAAQ